MKLRVGIMKNDHARPGRERIPRLGRSLESGRRQRRVPELAGQGRGRRGRRRQHHRGGRVSRSALDLHPRRLNHRISSVHAPRSIAFGNPTAIPIVESGLSRTFKSVFAQCRSVSEPGGNISLYHKENSAPSFESSLNLQEQRTT